MLHGFQRQLDILMLCWDNQGLIALINGHTTSYIGSTGRFKALKLYDIYADVSGRLNKHNILMSGGN